MISQCIPLLIQWHPDTIVYLTFDTITLILLISWHADTLEQCWVFSTAGTMTYWYLQCIPLLIPQYILISECIPLLIPWHTDISSVSYFCHINILIPSAYPTLTPWYLLPSVSHFCHIDIQIPLVYPTSDTMSYCLLVTLTFCYPPPPIPLLTQWHTDTPSVSHFWHYFWKIWHIGNMKPYINYVSYFHTLCMFAHNIYI